jgi:hypothetical protein
MDAKFQPHCIYIYTFDLRLELILADSGPVLTRKAPVIPLCGMADSARDTLVPIVIRAATVNRHGEVCAPITDAIATDEYSAQFRVVLYSRH